MELDKRKEALSDFDKAINLDSKENYRKTAGLYFFRGRIYIGLREPHLALKDFNRVIELDPAPKPGIFAYRGMVYSALSSYKQAIEDCTKAIELNAEGYLAYGIRGFAYHHLGNYTEALNDYDKVIALNPNDINTSYNIACIYSIRNDAIKACQWLRKTIENGFSDWEHLKGDRDFDNIRNSICFKEIIMHR